MFAASTRFRVQRPFIPRAHLRGGHLQTIFGNYMRRRNLLPLGEPRRFLVAGTRGGKDQAEVLCSCHWQPDCERRRATTLIIVHGLEGSMNSNYVIGTGSKAWARGMNVVRMNMRNCGDTEALTPTLYHSGLSGDVAAVTHALIAEEQLESIALVGFSMGGNLILKCAGEWGDRTPAQVKAVVGISPAMDLAVSAAALHSPANRIYEMRFMRSLLNRYRRKQALYPDLYGELTVRPFHSIWDFDERVTARYGGFAGADDYYARASSSRSLDRIQIPTLVIHALNDPFIRVTAATKQKLAANPHITFIETQEGGHCAFIAEPTSAEDDGRWAERIAVEFIAAQL